MIRNHQNEDTGVQTAGRAKQGLLFREIIVMNTEMGPVFITIISLHMPKHLKDIQTVTGEHHTDKAPGGGVCICVDLLDIGRTD